MNSSGNRVTAGRVVFFLLWCAGFAYLAFRHVPWRDELQSWLIVTRTATWQEFFAAVSYERQPPLYYLLLLAIKQAGLLLLPSVPQWHLPQFFSWGFSIASAAMVIFAFRAPWWIRFGMPLTIIMLLEYGVIARCYSPAMFFLLLAAYYYNKRSPTRVWCALALCASFHLYFTWIALLLFLFSLYDFRSGAISRNDYPLALLTLLAILGTFVTMVPPADSIFPSELNHGAISFKAFTASLAFAMTGLDSFSAPFSWNTNAWSGWTALWIWPALLLAGWSGFSLWRFLLISFVPLLFYAGAERFYFRYLAAIFLVSLFLELTSARVSRRFPVYALFVLSLVFMSGKWLWRWQPWNPDSRVAFSAAQELIDTQGALLKDAKIFSLYTVGHLYSVMARIDYPLDVYDVYRDRPALYPLFTSPAEGRFWENWCSESRPQATAQFAGRNIILIVPKSQPCPLSCQPVREIFSSRLIDLADESYRVCKLL